MNDHMIGQMLVFIVGGGVAFVVGWYLLGLGIGIAQRGYNRVAPYTIRNRVVEPPIFTFYGRPSTWEEWNQSDGAGGPARRHG
jgi:hypothetical protein